MRPLLASSPNPAHKSPVSPGLRKEHVVVIRRVGPLSCAKIAGLLYLILGFVFGACISLFAMTGLFAGGAGDGPLPMFFGAATIVVLPIFYGVGAFVGALIMASLFNLVAGMIGGVEVDAS